MASEASFDGMTFSKYMLSGATAGIAEHVAMFPVDTVKTRMQALAHPGQRLHGMSLHAAVSAIVRREGVLRMYRGVGAVAWSAGPAHALYFATYEVAKQSLGVQRSSHAPLSTAAAGAMATVVNDALMTPGDVVKQRLQLANSPYEGMLDCIVKTYRSEGIHAFFRSYKLTLLMNVPFTAVHFSAYETAKRLLSAEDDEGLTVQLLAGGTAGGLSAAITNPLDVVKTRIQTDGTLRQHRGLHSSSVIRELRTLIASEGYTALLHGMSARVAFHIPAAAVCWGTYETMKNLLSR